MRAHDWFESIRVKALEVERLERALRLAEERAGAKSQRYGSVSHSGSGDASGPVLAMIQTAWELEGARASAAVEVERAELVLYGKSGRGGVAKVKGCASADALCGYYLQGMDWGEVARDLVGHDEPSAKKFCMMRARRALDYIDRASRQIGLDFLVNS